MRRLPLTSAQVVALAGGTLVAVVCFIAFAYLFARVLTGFR